MAKPAISGSWGPPRASTDEIGRIRRPPGGSWWTRLFGVLLIVLASALALDPDYPLAWARPARESVSAGGGTYLLPRALSPKGPNSDRGLHFCWQWQGPQATWDVVLLDAALDEVARMRSVHGVDVMADETVSAALFPGGTFFWYAEGSLAGRTFRTAPTGFTRKP